ncbi:MAG: hypothetical protein DRO87_12570 [Candidatus Thorarchaeota archaeon]|nr:MAG: hypothetical protein DRO87_12570 [Candidatus Thorarchaeota archaeon]
MVRDVTPDVVDEEMKRVKLLFVDAWAPWCQPCLALAPTMDELEERYGDNEQVGFLKVNTQIHRDFAMQNNITGIPCVLIYVDGKPAKIEIPTRDPGKSTVIDRLVGLRPAEHYEYVINAVLNGPSS